MRDKSTLINRNYWVYGRRGAVSVEGSLARGLMRQTEICSDRADISV